MSRALLSGRRIHKVHKVAAYVSTIVRKREVLQPNGYILLTGAFTTGARSVIVGLISAGTTTMDIRYHAVLGAI